MIADRKALQHIITDEQKVWYTAGSNLIRLYMVALLQAGTLPDKYGTQTIPHWVRRPLQDYKNMIVGKPITDQQVADLPAIMVEDLSAGEVAMPMIEDGGSDNDSNDGDEVYGDCEEECGEFLEHYLAEEAEEAPLVEELEVPPTPQQSEQELEEGHAEQQVNVEDAETQAGGRQELRPRRKLEVKEWGCASYARKVTINQKGNEVFSFECRCVHHKKSQTTPTCNKSFGFTAATEDIADNAARYWLRQAAFHKLRSSHLGCVRDIWSVPLFDEDLLLREHIQDCQQEVMFDEKVLAAEAELQAGGADEDVHMDPADIAAADVDSSEMGSASD